MSRVVVAGILTCLALAPPGARAADCAYEDPAFAAGALRPGLVLLVPPRSEIVDAQGRASSDAAGLGVLEAALAAEVRGRLETLGYAVDGWSLGPATIASDAEARSRCEAAWRAYEERLASACDADEVASRRRIELGDVLLPLGLPRGASAVAFVRSRTLLRSRNVANFMRALRFVVPDARWPGPQADATWAEVSLVDTATGTLLISSVAVTEGAVERHPARVVADAVSSALAAWPARDRPSAWALGPERPREPRRVVTSSPRLMSFLERTSAGLGSEARHERVGSGLGRAVHADAADLLAAPPATPSVRLPLARRPGPPGLVVENALDVGVRVSVSLGPWLDLGPGDTVLVDVEPGRAWILVTDEDGDELARAACDDAVSGRVVAWIAR